MYIICSLSEFDIRSLLELYRKAVVSVRKNSVVIIRTFNFKRLIFYFRDGEGKKLLRGREGEGG